MSDISIPNFVIIGGGPMALLSAYYINFLLPTSSIVILDNRGSYTRGVGWEFTISVEVIKYLKKTFSYDIKFINFLDDITKILKECNTFPINALEIALYNNLQSKIYIIKCKVSLDEDKILVINKIDSTNLSEDCCEKQIDFLKRFKIDYILNCTGGRLDTRIYWKSTIDETNEYLTELTNTCLQNAGIEEKHLSELKVSLLPTSENPLWYVRSLQTFYDLPHRGFQEFDKLSALKPSTKIKIQVGDTFNECPLFNIGDSIMTVDYRKKIGLALGMSNIRIILDIITNPQDDLEELYVERIVENFYKLSQELLLFCTIPEYLYFIRDNNNQKYKYFNLLTDKGRVCNTDIIAPRSASTWSEDIIKCTLTSNPDNLTEDELKKCLPLPLSSASPSPPQKVVAEQSGVESDPKSLISSAEEIEQYNQIQDQLYDMNFNKQPDDKKKIYRKSFDELITQGMELKKKLKEKNVYHTIKKKVHLENNFNPLNYYKKGDRIVIAPSLQGENKYGGKIQNKKTKKRKENKKFKKQKNEKKTKNLKNKKKRTKKRQQKNKKTKNK